MFRKLINYLSGARQEVKKINWPTSQEVFHKTIVVILFASAVTLVLGGFDFLFNRAVLNLVATQGSPDGLDVQDFELDPGSAGQGEPIEIQVGDEEASGSETVEIDLGEGE